MDPTCGRCGRTVPDYVRVCEHCGHVVAESPFSLLGLSIDSSHAPEPMQGGFDFAHDEQPERPADPPVEPAASTAEATESVTPAESQDEEPVLASDDADDSEDAPPSIVSFPVGASLLRVPAETAPPPPRANARMIVFVTLACIVSAALTFGVLVARSAPSTTVSAASTTSEVVANRRAGAPKEPSWSSANTSTWAGRERNSVAFEMQAENTIAVWMRTVRPMLVVRCAGGSMEAFVFTASAARIEPQTEDHTVRMSFDAAAPVSERWRDSEEHDALFAPDGTGFVRRLLDVRTFTFEFTPHNASPVAAHFAVAGLRPHLQRAARQCGRLE